VAAGVASRSGDLLAGAHQCETVVEDMPPAFFFASRGTVLPAGQNGGLPVVTVNTPEVDVQFLRVEPAQLPAFLDKVHGIRRAPSGEDDGSQTENADAYAEGYEGEYYDGGTVDLRGRTSGWTIDRLKDMSTSVYLGRFQTDDKRDRRHVSFLPVEHIKELREPGLYVAVMNVPGSFSGDYQTTYFYVSDIGLHLHRNGARIDAFATSLKSGSALDAVDLELLDGDGKRVGAARAGEDGRATFDAHFCQRTPVDRATWPRTVGGVAGGGGARPVGIRCHRSAADEQQAVRLERPRPLQTGRNLRCVRTCA
jgi:uncharacterized protein YfaS (alpha-2-macroglobulin family)